MKKITILALAMMLTLSLMACGQPANQPSTEGTTPVSQSSEETTASTEASSETSTAAAMDHKPVSLVTFNDTYVTYDKIPERVVSFNLHTTENLFALGLQDKIIGTAYNNAEILPEYKEEFVKIPALAEKYPAMEVLLNANPDFVYGRSSAFGEKGVASVKTFVENGIMPYVSKATYTNGATMKDTYADFINLGKIFGVEDRANEIVEKMKAQIKEVEDKLAGQSEKLKVFVYDSGDKEAFTAGQSLQSDIIEKAGGHNVFADIPKTWVSVNWEEVVKHNPDVIVINDYGKTSAEDKIKMIKENKALSNVNAVKNDRFVVLPLPSVFTGIRNGDAVTYLAKEFYPEIFK